MERWSDGKKEREGKRGQREGDKREGLNVCQSFRYAGCHLALTPRTELIDVLVSLCVCAGLNLDIGIQASCFEC